MTKFNVRKNIISQSISMGGDIDRMARSQNWCSYEHEKGKKDGKKNQKVQCNVYKTIKCVYDTDAQGHWTLKKFSPFSCRLSLFLRSVSFKLGRWRMIISTEHCRKWIHRLTIRRFPIHSEMNQEKWIGKKSLHSRFDDGQKEPSNERWCNKWQEKRAKLLQSEKRQRFSNQIFITISIEIKWHTRGNTR